MSVRATYRFARIPEWIVFHPQLTGHDIRLFAVLDRHDGRDCHPRLATIAREMGDVSQQTVRRSVKALEDVGAITVSERFDPDGRQTTNEYQLAGDQPIGQAPLALGGPSTGDRGGPSTGDRPLVRARSIKDSSATDVAGADVSSPPKDASLSPLVRTFVDVRRECGSNPTQPTKEKLAGHLKRLRDREHKPVEVLEMAVIALAREGKPPGLIDLVVEDAERELAGKGVNGHGTLQQTRRR